MHKISGITHHASLILRANKTSKSTYKQFHNAGSLRLFWSNLNTTVLEATSLLACHLVPMTC